jgi:ribosome-associated protein
LIVTKKISTKRSVLLSVNAALEKKARRILVLNVKKMSSLSDYFIICSGNSDRQVQAIASFIEETLKKAGKRPIGIEGERVGKWVLMDYGDVVIHIFYDPIRDFYDLERLWTDVPRLEIEDDATGLESLGRGM